MYLEAIDLSALLGDDDIAATHMWWLLSLDSRREHRTGTVYVATTPNDCGGVGRSEGPGLSHPSA